MKSEKHGAGTLVKRNGAEILNVSPNGVWIMINGSEYFMDFERFPWFKRASIEQIFDVSLLHSEHLFWRELDVDLHVDCLANPEKYPLVADQPRTS